MATERQWFAEGVLIDEREPSTEFFVEGVQINETVAAPPGGLSIPIAAYHYNHHLGSMAG